LLKEIKKAIQDHKIETWKVDSDGDFMHTPEQWANLAWLRPKAMDDRLLLNILGSKTRKLSRTTYAVYHGKFIEMLLTHFDTKFNRATATALPVSGDILPSPE
jgi:hypothetical protein